MISTRDIQGDIEKQSEPISSGKSEEKPISNIYRCDICGKAFDNEKSLEMHKLRSHRIGKAGATTPGGREPRQPARQGPPPPEITFLEEVKAKLKERLPKVYGLTQQAAHSIIETLTPAIAKDPLTLFYHVRNMAGRKINEYHLWLVLQGIFGELGYPYAPTMPVVSAHSPFTPTIPTPYIPQWYMSYRDNPEINLLMNRLEKLEDELREERERRFESELKRLESKIDNKPSFIDEYRMIMGLAEEMGLTTKKSTIDLLDRLAERFDRRIESLQKTISRGPPAIRAGSFKPEISYSPYERAKIAKKIESRLEKARDLIETENALIRACAKLAESEALEHGRRRRR